ncbi:MAG: hypothetical protein ACE5IY_05460, partial [bacterium]
MKRLQQVIFLSILLAGLVGQPSARAQQISTRQDSAKQTVEQPPDFEPLPDRWRDIQPPPYELNVRGRWYDPYNRNILKGDYP